MALPYFYLPDLSPDQIVLDEATSKHIVQVLRMEADELLLLTDGKGGTARASITDPNRKRCAVQVTARTTLPRRDTVAIAVSPTKNAARFEWFLEKATEIGVGTIIPLLCKRTERSKFRTDRWHGIVVSAMLQSQQAWLPLLQEPMEFNQVVRAARNGALYIAHCLDEQPRASLATAHSAGAATLLIGPEGDFAPEEIAAALQHGFQPVSLGSTRLRTETAALVGAVILVEKVL